MSRIHAFLNSRHCCAYRRSTTAGTAMPRSRTDFGLTSWQVSSGEGLAINQRGYFTVGNLYSSEEIQQSLGVGNAGGVRVSVGESGRVRRVAIMTSVPTARQATENPYHDRIEGDILVYTGSGREGEQSLAGANKRLPQQLTDDFPMYCFLIVGSRRNTNIGPQRWKFLGLLEYLRHYPDTQMDTRGDMRKVWLFEFRIHENPSTVDVDRDFDTSSSLLSESRALERSSGDSEMVAEAPEPSGTRVESFEPAELEAIRSHLLAKPAEEFEHFIKQLMMATGYDRVNVTRFNQDGGVDINAFAGQNMWAVEHLLVQVQAKRWLHTVGRKEVAELRGSLEPHARGTIVTTSHYSKAAIVEATAPGKSPIVLVDGYSLARIFKRSGLPL